MSGPDQLLLLAGGGHSHALLLRRWLMRPQLKPKRTAVVLVNRGSTALYSGMVPGLVAGLYSHEDCAIDLRDLCQRAGVAFVRAEITGIDLPRSQLCGKCDSMFCPDCWDCPTLMPQCAACTATMCNACAKRAEECADADGNTACPSCGAFICIDCCLEWCKVCHPV